MLKRVAALLLLVLLTSCKEKQAEIPHRHYDLVVNKYILSGYGEIDGANVIDLVSLPGESETAFFIRTGYELLVFTHNTNFEACGRFAISKTEGDPTLAIRLWTNRSHKGCLVTKAAPPGFVAVGEYIHTHPVRSPVIFNANDVTLTGNRFTIGAKVALNTTDFSEEDYAGGPGYLVADRKLLYQNGKHRKRLVAYY